LTRQFGRSWFKMMAVQLVVGSRIALRLGCFKKGYFLPSPLLPVTILTRQSGQSWFKMMAMQSDFRSSHFLPTPLLPALLISVIQNKPLCSWSLGLVPTAKGQPELTSRWRTVIAAIVNPPSPGHHGETAPVAQRQSASVTVVSAMGIPHDHKDNNLHVLVGQKFETRL